MKNEVYVNGVRLYAAATPTGADAHYDAPLSNFASSAFNDQDSQFIADQVFPAISVGKQSDKFYVIDRGDFFRVPETLRAPRTAAKRIGFRVSSDSYFAHNYALAGENALEDIDGSDDPIALRQNTSRLVTLGLRRDQEVRVANLVTSISNVGSGAQQTGAAAWNALDSADVIGQCNTAHAFMRRQTGLVPDTMIIDWDSLMLVRRNTRLLELFKYTSGGQLSDEQLLAHVFKVRRLLVGQGVVENRNEPNTGSVTNIWGNNAVFLHVGQATGLQSQTFGARFQWRPPSFPAPFGVITRREDGAGQRKVEVLEAGYFQAEKVIAADLAYVINTVSGSTL